MNSYLLHLLVVYKNCLQMSKIEKVSKEKYYIARERLVGSVVEWLTHRTDD